MRGDELKDDGDDISEPLGMLLALVRRDAAGVFWCGVGGQYVRLPRWMTNHVRVATRGRCKTMERGAAT